VTLTQDAGPAERLSTAPAPAESPPAGGRRRRTPRAVLRLGWRRLTSMRTALQLLFVLSLGAVPGGLLPQRGQEPQAVAAYLRNHRTLGPLLDRLYAFDVFAAPWFAAVYLLLFVSLIGCLGPRIRQHARALRRPPPATPSRLQRFAAYAAWETDLPPAEVADRGAGLLRGWRTARVGTAVSAERGYARETGNLVFHVCLVLLLAGIGLGSAFGYESDRVLVEGAAYANTPSQLDQFRPGRLVRAADLQPWLVRLDAFDAVYLDDGTPKSFDAHVTFTPAGGSPRPEDVRVNHPLFLGDGAKLYLLNHGYAPTFRLTGPDGVARDDAGVICRTIAPQTGLASCVTSFAVTPPGAAPRDLAFEVTFAPTGSFDPQLGLVSAGPALASPDALVAAYVGALGTPSSVFGLDKRLLTPVLRDGAPRVDNLVVNGTPDRRVMADLPGGFQLQVARVDEWASFQVKRDPAKRLVLLAAVGIVGGLLLSLRVRRRRVWVRATAAAGSGGPGEAPRRTLVEVAGLARSDAPASRAELDALVEELRRVVPAAKDEVETHP